MSVAVDDAQETVQESLLVRAKAGEAEAFCHLIRPLQDRCYRQALALCGRSADAEDLVQETFVAAWKSLRRFDGRCRFSTWLYSILLHRHKKRLRAQRSRPQPVSSLSTDDMARSEEILGSLPSPEPIPSAQLVGAERAGFIRRMVLALPAKQRRVILLRFFAEVSLEEIATVTRCSVGTVKSRLHYALERLRRDSLNLLPAREDIQP